MLVLRITFSRNAENITYLFESPLFLLFAKYSGLKVFITLVYKPSTP